MFFVRLIILTGVFFLFLTIPQRSAILNFSQVFNTTVFPALLGYSGYFLRALFYALLIFIVVALLCYFYTQLEKRLIKERRISSIYSWNREKAFASCLTL